jgi:uncharacterized protein YecT (DUF1311 family)
MNFGFIGCTDNNLNNSQSSNESDIANNKDNEEDINKTDSNLKDKISENSKVINSQEKDGKLNENDNNNSVKESEKQIYKNKLDNIQLGLKDLDTLYAGNTIEMKSAASQEYERWDKALNEIYGVLKQQLSSDDMSKLKAEQIKWISDRDVKAKEESLEYQGGTAEQLVYISSLAETTKERCYELVDKYMK